MFTNTNITQNNKYINVITKPSLLLKYYYSSPLKCHR